jgi:ubiquinone/menaquinone biosynthesis C-methylase UbiE
LLSGEGTYQKDLILPNLLRLLEIKKGETILDLGCGPGFFANEFAGKGAKVIGVDISKKLIEMAKKNSAFSRQQLLYFVAPANKLTFLKDESADKIVMVLAVQNMENPREVFVECARVLKPDGKIFIVMNHPAFRIPKESGWEWDAKKKIQYRRIDRYLSELKSKIQTHPGDKPKEHTFSFHRPLQFYFKALEKSGFCVSRLEEWSSHKKSEPGPRADAENRSRKEIPLFLFLEAVK